MPPIDPREPLKTRERILAATWRLMEESGDLKVRIADIAAAAGVSRQAVYLHFGDRPNLLLAAVKHRDRTSPTIDIVRAAEEAPPRKALAAFVAAWFAHIPRVLPIARLLSAASQVDAEARAAWEDRMSLLRRHTTTLAGRLAEAGLLRAPWTVETAADWIWHRTHLDGWRQLVTDRSWAPEDYARAVTASLERDLLAAD